MTAQVLVLGLAFIGGSRLSDSTYAIAGSRLGALLRRSGRARRAERYVSSDVYVGLGLTTAVAGGHATASS